MKDDSKLLSNSPKGHPILGKSIIERGKTKKFKMYEKGFTYKKPISDELEVLWKDVTGISFSWEKNTSKLRWFRKIRTPYLFLY